MASDVSIPLRNGGVLPAAFFPVPGAVGPRPGVLVLHELLGLTDEMRRLAGQFADAGFSALAPDFLHGLGPRPFCIARFVRGVGRRGTGRPYRQLDAARLWLAARPEVAGGPIGVAGFCIGGGFALLYAAGAEVQAVAPFYPAVPDDETLAGICPVVASFGGRDSVFGAGGAPLEAALGRLGVPHDVRTYPNAGHGFMARYDGPLAWITARLPTHVAHDPEAAADAWRRTVAFFSTHLGEGRAAASGAESVA